MNFISSITKTNAITHHKKNSHTCISITKGMVKMWIYSISRNTSPYQQ